jgi:MFS family permease
MGLGLGLDVHRAALLVVGCQTAVALGALGCGVLADHLNRRALKLGTGVVMCLVPLAVPVVLHGPGVWLALPLWGAAQGGLFTVGMVKLGTRFSGATLARAMALSMVIYTLGGLFGPPALGAVMALLGSAGLVYGLAAVAVVGTGVIASL